MAHRGNYKGLRQDGEFGDPRFVTALQREIVAEYAAQNKRRPDLGIKGPHKDGIDGDYGPLTFRAFHGLDSAEQDKVMQRARADLGHKPIAQVAAPAAQAAAPATPPPPPAPRTASATPSRQPPRTMLSLPVVSDAPLLQPPLETKGTIVLDPGHGGLIRQSSGKLEHDPGAEGMYQGQRVTEADANWLLANDIKKELQASGYNVVMTKDNALTDHIDRNNVGDAKPMAVDRTGKAPDAQAYVSIHQDARGRNGESGIQVNYSPLARNVDKVLAKTLASSVGGRPVQNARDIAVLEPQFHAGVGPHPRPAVLIEATNFDSPSDIANVMDPARRQEMAHKIALGIESSIHSPALQAAMNHKGTISPKPGRASAALLTPDSSGG